MARFPFLKHYPGTNLHEIDLDYVLRVTDSVYKQTAALSEWADLHEEEYEDLAEKVDGLINNLVDVIVPWDSSIEYPIYSIVEYQGTNYIAVKPVPVGAMITNTEYWQPANTVIEQINAIGIKTNEIVNSIVYVDYFNFAETLNTQDVNRLLAEGKALRIPAGSYSLTEPLEINTSGLLYFDNVSITQEKWGYPALVITTGNVQLEGLLTVTAAVTERVRVDSSNSWLPDSGDPKAACSGVLIMPSEEIYGIRIDTLKVFNFIGGVTNISGYPVYGLIIDTLYINNVDFGVLGSRFFGTTVHNLLFKDIASYVGSEDPSHAVYLTGGGTTLLSSNVRIDNIYGSGCKAKNTDSLLSFKSCKGVEVGSVVASDINELLQTGNGSFAIHGGSVSSNRRTFLVQGNAQGPSLIENVHFTVSDSDEAQVGAVTGGGKLEIRGVTVDMETMTPGRMFYVSSASMRIEHGAFKVGTVSTHALVFITAPVSELQIDTPVVSGMPLIAKSGTADVNKIWCMVNAKDLSNMPSGYPIGNEVTYSPAGYVFDEPAASANYPIGFRYSNYVRVTNANVQYFNTNNVFDGNVYTLINGGGASITAGTRIVTKKGTSYGASEWHIFRFMNIGNVAYEV